MEPGDPPLPPPLDGDDSPLMELVASIDEGRPIDWDRAAQAADSAEGRQLIEGLRVLAGVAGTFAAREPAAEEDLSGLAWGPLEIVERVGRGAFGTVYRAKDSLGRDVALKVLDPRRGSPDLAARILEEGRYLARAPHPNIVVVHGAGEHDGRVGLWMEFVEGRTLADELQASGPMSPDEACVIGRRLCSALGEVHRAGFVHADVKAQNVMRQRGGRIVLMDFGAGHATADPDPDRLAGTPLYLSPERFAGGAPSIAGDIYALGALLYHLVTGAFPVDGRTREEVEQAHRRHRRVGLRDRRSELPDDFVDAVERAIDPDPANRFPSAGAFDDALARVGGGRWPLFRGRTRWSFALVAALVVVALGSAAVLRSWRPASAPPAVLPIVANDSYSVRAAFYRVAHGVRTPLAPGDPIAPHDALGLDLEVSKDAFVYVINEDDKGGAFGLFPLPGAALQNPLKAGQVVTLPGRVGGKVQQWNVTSPGGREHLFVVVSPTARPDVEDALQRLEHAAEGRAVETGRDGGAAARLRGVGGLVDAPEAPRPDTPAPWRLAARPLSAGNETVRGAWIRQLTLVNGSRPPADAGLPGRR